MTKKCRIYKPIKLTEPIKVEKTYTKTNKKIDRTYKNQQNMKIKRNYKKQNLQKKKNL